MQEPFNQILAAGGHANSLGRVNEVIEIVLKQKSRLDELYGCLFEEDAWVRMRAADALEKICRTNPEWLLPYIDRLAKEVSPSAQPSLQWHLAQIYREVALTPKQRQFAIQWLRQVLSRTDVDWIVAANAMTTLVQFTLEGFCSKNDTVALLNKQKHHKSPAVVRRADKLLAQL